MATVKDVIEEIKTRRNLDTGKISGLSRQIIAEMNLMIPNVLINFENLSNVVVGSGNHMNPFLQFAAKESLRSALKDHPGKKMTINSAYRTIAQQYILYQLYVQKTGLVSLAAKPGWSNHEDGLALDVSNYEEWKNILDDYGWRWQGSKDPVHFSFTGSGRRDEVGELGVKAFQQLWNKYNPNDKIEVDGDFGKQTATRMNQSPAQGFAAIKLFRLGDNGDEIKRIQQALVNAGFSLPMNGQFDAATEAAVEEFQEREQLAADGIVGTLTLKALGLVF